MMDTTEEEEIISKCMEMKTREDKRYLKQILENILPKKQKKN